MIQNLQMQGVEEWKEEAYSIYDDALNDENNEADEGYQSYVSHRRS